MTRLAESGAFEAHALWHPSLSKRAPGPARFTLHVTYVTPVGFEPTHKQGLSLHPLPLG